MKDVRRILLLVMSLLLVLAVFSACAKDTTDETDVTGDTDASAGTESDATGAEDVEDTGMTFGFSVATLDNPYFIEVANGFEAACKEAGIEPVINDAAYDATTQYNQIENYISMGCDAICIAPVDANSLESVVEKAQEAGIIVISEAQGISNADANVIVDDYEYGVVNGTNAATWINDKLDGVAKVLLITLDHVEAVILRGNGMEDIIKEECPNSEIVARQGAESMEDAMQVAETVLQANPDVNVIACVNDQLALGAYEAVKNMGIEDDNFFIGGADNTEEMLSKMKEDGSYLRSTIDIKPYDTGMTCVDVIRQNINNGSEEGKNYFFEMVPVWQEDLS